MLFPEYGAHQHFYSQSGLNLRVNKYIRDGDKYRIPPTVNLGCKCDRVMTVFNDIYSECLHDYFGSSIPLSIIQSM